MTRAVHVELGDRSYRILIGSGLLARTGELTRSVTRGSKVAVITDDTVGRLYLEQVLASIDDAGIHHEHLVLSPGESAKTWSTAGQIADWLLSRHIERQDTVLALGGGVIGDLAGFAAAIVRRGVDCIQLPTTLLAQVDSSVGGKTGINTPRGKNLIGSFHQPSLVVCDIGALASLDRRDLLAGYGEVLKYSLLGDDEFFHYLDNNQARITPDDHRFMSYIIEQSCRMKAELVSIDERETGDRAKLNLGHTFGHALEALTGYSDRILHGEAVAIGCMIAFEVSCRMGLCSEGDMLRVRRHLTSMGMKSRLSQIPGELPGADRILKAMQQDKKVRMGQLHLVLVNGIGSAFVTSKYDPGIVAGVLEASASAG